MYIITEDFVCKFLMYIMFSFIRKGLLEKSFRIKSIKQNHIKRDKWRTNVDS